jgi:hypothetical protein
MHGQLINTRRCTVAVIILGRASVDRAHFPSRVGLLCIGQQSTNLATALAPNHAAGALRRAIHNIADPAHQWCLQLHNLAPMSFLLPQLRTSLPPHLVVAVSTAVVLDENIGNESNSTNVAQ